MFRGNPGQAWWEKGAERGERQAHEQVIMVAHECPMVDSGIAALAAGADDLAEAEEVGFVVEERFAVDAATEQVITDGPLMHAGEAGHDRIM